MSSFRIATYNIHKCKGFDRRTSPQRIIDILATLDADILCLQEVVDAPSAGPLFDQASEIARGLPAYDFCFGTNRPLHGGNYGNMTLTRLPLRQHRNHNLSHAQREERGVLQADIELPGGPVLHIFNVHLGTGHYERRAQGSRLLSPHILGHPDLVHPRLILGDFNEWTRGLTTKLLEDRFSTFRPEHAFKIPRTFPGLLPILSLDYFYYDPPLDLRASRLIRSPAALLASDHLPLVADFELNTTAPPR